MQSEKEKLFGEMESCYDNGEAMFELAEAYFNKQFNSKINANINEIMNHLNNFTVIEKEIGYKIDSTFINRSDVVSHISKLFNHGS